METTETPLLDAIRANAQMTDGAMLKAVLLTEKAARIVAAELYAETDYSGLSVEVPAAMFEADFFATHTLETTKTDGIPYRIMSRNPYDVMFLAERDGKEHPVRLAFNVVTGRNPYKMVGIAKPF